MTMTKISLKDLSAELVPGQPHHQNWYVVCLADEIKKQGVVGKDFLNGRVAIFRKANGKPVVVTARCPHMGADLSLGDVVNDTLRCTYHHFCFADDGHCTSVPPGNNIPPAAKVFSYPCVEHLGLIWAFNGEQPLFDPPGVRDFSIEQLHFRARKTDVFSVAPFINIGNSFDYLHLRYVHNIEFAFDPQAVRYVDDYHIENTIRFGSIDSGFESRILVSGSNTVAHVTMGKQISMGLFTCTPIGKESHSYFVSMAPNCLAYSEVDIEKGIQYQERFSAGLLMDDVRTLTGIKFKVGAMVREDKSMVDFLKWVIAFPTALPAAQYE